MSAEIQKRAKCCASGGRIDRLNLVSLERRCTWEFPRAENVLTGYGPDAIAVCCDRCVERSEPVKYAIELRGADVIYHPIDELEPLGPEPTCVIASDGQSIECLVCGRISHNPDDVANRYCGYCHAFHPIRTSDRRKCRLPI